MKSGILSPGTEAHKYLFLCCCGFRSESGIPRTLRECLQLKEQWPCARRADQLRAAAPSGITSSELQLVELYSGLGSVFQLRGLMLEVEAGSILWASRSDRFVRGQTWALHYHLYYDYVSASTG